VKYVAGELITVKGVLSETAVWNDKLDNSYEKIKYGEVITVVNNEDDCGWVRIITCRGFVGIVHRSNLKRFSSFT
jgi:hypothetical protein